MDKLALELPLLLPDAPDFRDHCVSLLMATLVDRPGVDRAHIVDATDSATSRLCLHYDPDLVSAPRIQALARAAGAELTSRYQHLVWPVDGVRRRRHADRIAQRLRSAPGVVEAEVTVGLARVELDTAQGSVEEVERTLGDLGVHRRGEDHDHGADEHAHHHGGPFGERSELVLAVASGVLLLAGYLLDVLGAVPEPIPVVLYLAVYLSGGWFTTIEAFQSVRNGRFEIDFLMLVAALGAAALGELAEGALLLFLFATGHALEGYALGRARQAIEALAELAPRTARVRRGSDEEDVPVESLMVGERVLVRPGERVAADGFIIEGASSVDQSAVTGESIPVQKQPVEDAGTAAERPDRLPVGNRVFAGTINGIGRLEIIVTHTSRDSTLARVVNLVREAETQTSPTQRFTDKFERVFVPAVLVLVVGLLVVGPLTGSDVGDTFYRAMAVLVAASPCALAIATPSAVLAAVARSGRAGVLVKGGGPLETLGRITAIAFDKTGTLTEGRPRLTDVLPATGVDELELLQVAAAAERGSEHPLADAIVRDALVRLNGSALPVAEEVTARVGRGLTARIGDEPVWVGSEALFADDPVPPPDEVVNASLALRGRGRTVVLVRRGRRYLGVLGLMDTPRQASRATLERLRQLGITRSVLLSGDHQVVARAIGNEVGVDEAWGDLMPADKVSAIGLLRADEGEVAMVGDGVNDAPALAHANVGIAMGAAGSDVALETADIALMGDNLAKLPFAVELSRQARRVIRQNLLVSLGVVALLIPATLGGFVGIGPAVFLHEGSTLLVVANALRLLAHRGDELTPP